MQSALLKTINKNILIVAGSEKVTKETLSTLSRDLLEYIGINGSNDIGAVNRLLNVLTPMNLSAATLFFNHFMPFKLENKGVGQFGAKVTDKKQIIKYHERVVEFMADKSNDIWSWINRNVDIKPRVPFSDKISAVVKQAMEGIKDKDDREGLAAISPAEILKAVMSAGVSMDDLFATIDATPASADGVMPPKKSSKGKAAVKMDDTQEIDAMVAH